MLFVLVHDTCFGSWVWSKLETDLKSAGHDVTAVKLPTPFLDVSTADAYSQPLLDVLNGLPDSKRAVIVAHGMGGINAAIAMDNYPNKIAVTIFVNAFLPDTTNSPSYVIEKYSTVFKNWQDTQFVEHPTTGGLNITTMKLGSNFLQESMYQLSPFQDVQRAKQWTVLGSFFKDGLAVRSYFTFAGYGSVPKAYIASKKDKAMPLEFQKWQMNNYSLSDKDRYELDNADHMPMMSVHAQLSDLLQTIAKKYAAV